MSLLFLFCGGYILLNGLTLILDTIVWKIAAGEQFIRYGAEYAAMRHQFYYAELAMGAVAVFFGALHIVLFLCSTKRCRRCGKRILKKQKFCHNCGKITLP